MAEPLKKEHSHRRAEGRPPFHGFAEIEYAENIFSTLRRVLAYFTHEKALMLFLLFFVVVSTICLLIGPSMQSETIDVIAGKREGTLWLPLGIMLGVYLGYSVCSYCQAWLSAKLGQKIVKRMREELFGKLLDLPVKYLDTHSHGDVMSRMTNDIENVSMTVTMSLPSIVSGGLTILGVAAMMFWYCWQLALLSMVTVALTVTATHFLSAYVRKYSRQRQKLLGELNGNVEEFVSGYRTVVAYNHQEKTIDDFCATSDSLTKAGIRTDAVGGTLGPVMNCISNVGFVIIAACGGYFSLNGLISVGVISAFIVYARVFSRPVNELAMVYGQLQTAIAGAERVFKVLDERNEETGGKILTASKGANVVFDKVDFSYLPDKPVIRDFSLTVRGAQKVALVGATGCGKTTIVNLLMRFYDPDSGKILIDGQDISQVSRSSLRKSIAIVLQDTVLFSDTIRNNLLFANSDASEKMLEEAMTMSRCREFIEKLPDGLETRLIGSGSNLSQGQRQLMAIARAYVADPDILILDEATSNVDTRTEKAIQDAMRKVMQNRTSIVIAHRLSTIRDSDVIIVMDAGRIIESGSHEQLLGQKGKYYNLIMTQYAGNAI